MACVSDQSTAVPGGTLLQRLASRARRFTQERSGASAIEFAFLAPVLIAIYVSSFEITTGYSVSQKTAKAAGAIADCTRISLSYVTGAVLPIPGRGTKGRSTLTGG